MKITLTTQKKQKPDFSALGFGKYFTDHMLVMDYKDGKWGEVEIMPYQNFSLDPATLVLHYGQGIFEGAKAYRNQNGEMRLFRIRDNFVRLNNSAKRLCMPEIDDIDRVIEGLKELIRIEKDWIPTAPGTALYIRPTMIATDARLGVHASNTYKLYIILSPVGSYYAAGLTPTKIIMEDKYVRVPKEGTGEAKCMGNYAASLLAGEKAAEKGFDQVLWLDSHEMKYVEEVGAMNMFFVFDDTVVTPALIGSILPGITRNSALQVLRRNGYKVEERRVSVDEIEQRAKDGSFKEAFGTGTAAVISPVGLLNYKGEDIIINGGEMGPVSQFLYDTITGIQNGRIEDTYGWVTLI